MSAVRRWAPSVLWGTIIFIATSIPGSALPAAPDVPGTDKVVHLLLYGVLGYLVGTALGARASRRAWLGALAIVAVVAAADEWHQDFIPGRRGDVADWVADVAGATLGGTLSLTALRRRETSL